MQRHYGSFRDAEGRGYPGASVTVYLAGTSTLATLYSPSGSISAPAGLANPFTTDANGLYGFAVGNGTYDIQITGGSMPTEYISNLTIGTTDITTIEASSVTNVPSGTISSINVQDAINEIVSNLADPTTAGNGDALVAVKSVLTGGTARTQHQKNADVVSVKDFGAVGNDSALDTAAFQAACLALATTGGAIYVPGGLTYLVKSCRVYPNTRIIGDGIGNTIIQQPAAMLSTDRVTDDGTGHDFDGVPLFYSAYPAVGREVGISLQGMTLDGNGLNQVAGGAKNSWGTYFNGVTGVKILDCEIKNFLLHGGCIKEGNNCVIDGCSFYANGQSATIWDPVDGAAPKGDGLCLLSRCYDNTVSNCVAELNTAIGFEDEGRFGVYNVLNRNYRNKWVNLVSKDNLNHNYLVLFTDYSLWVNCHSIGGTTNGFNLVGNTYTTLDNVDVYTAGFNGIWIRPETHGADGTNRYITITNAKIVDSVKRGLVVTDCHDSSFTNISIRGIGDARAVSFETTASTDIELQLDYDGDVGTRASYGIYALDTTRLTIRNSDIKACNVYGIWFDGTTTDFVVQDTRSIGAITGRGINLGTIAGHSNKICNCDVSANALSPNSWNSAKLAVSNVIGYARTVYLTATPTTGTWELRDRISNATPTVGQPKAWVTSVAGTLGTLAGVTGDITNGTKLLTVNSVANISVGNYLTIAGVTGVKRVASISALVVTIDVNADATVTGAAVAYQAPTFTSEGNL